MKYTLLLLICFGTIACFGQIYIKYDLNTRSLDKPVPFDKPFSLEVSPVQSSTVNQILVFQIGYKKGLVVFEDPTNPVRGDFRASFELDKDKRSDETKLVLSFPALKPERDFRIQLRGSYSTGNNKRVYALLHGINELIKKNIDISTDSGLANSLKILKDSVEIKKPGDMLPIATLQMTINEIEATFYKPSSAELGVLLDSTNTNAKYFIPAFFDQQEIESIANDIDSKSFSAKQLFCVQRLLDDRSLKFVMLGMLPYNYKNRDKKINSFNFDARLKNMNVSKAYFDSLRVSIAGLKTKMSGKYTALLSKADEIYRDLDANQEIFASNLKIVNKQIAPKLQQITNLVDGSTISADLQTISKRHFTLEAGVANLWVYDNLNQQQQLFKPFIGVTYHFRSLDKSNDLTRLPRPARSNNNYSHSLESRYSFWQRVSMTFGLTLGSISNKDFDNVYGSFSFLLGPSFHLVDGVRISAGASAVKRLTSNPLLSDKKTIYGTYASVSLDYDLLDAIKGVTSMIFK